MTFLNRADSQRGGTREKGGGADRREKTNKQDKLQEHLMLLPSDRLCVFYHCLLVQGVAPS